MLIQLDCNIQHNATCRLIKYHYRADQLRTFRMFRIFDGSFKSPALRFFSSCPRGAHCANCQIRRLCKGDKMLTGKRAEFDVSCCERTCPRRPRTNLLALHFRRKRSASRGRTRARRVRLGVIRFERRDYGVRQKRRLKNSNMEQ